MLEAVQARRRVTTLNGAAILIVVAMMLAIPGTAFGTAFFKGPVNGGANNAGVEFRVKFGHGDPKKVVEFRWFNVPVPPSCADSFDGTRFKMRVNDRHRFRGKYSVPNTNHVARVRGRLKHHDQKAAGTLKLKGSFAGGCSNADTGRLAWTAKRAGAD